MNHSHFMISNMQPTDPNNNNGSPTDHNNKFDQVSPFDFEQFLYSTTSHNHASATTVALPTPPPSSLLISHHSHHHHPQATSFTDLLGVPDDLMDDVEHLMTTMNQQSPHHPQQGPQEPQQVMTMMTSSTRSNTNENESSRSWKVVSSKLNLSEFSVKLKTRREAKPSEIVPENLYSSIKYEVHLTAIGPSIKQVPFLLARASVIDAQSQEKVQLSSTNSGGSNGGASASSASNNNNSKTNAVLKGDIEASMSKTPTGSDDMVKGLLKIQLNPELSYHHEKRLLCLVVELFEAESLGTPVAVAQSASVKCYARKPNKKYPKKKTTTSEAESTQNKKRSNNNNNRKKDSEEDDADEDELDSESSSSRPSSPPAAKKSRPSNTAEEVPVSSSTQFNSIPGGVTAAAAAVSGPSTDVSHSTESAFLSFKRKLDELVESNASQTEEVKFMCLSYLLNKIMTSEPLAANMLMPYTVNPYYGMFQQHHAPPPPAFNLQPATHVPPQPLFAPSSVLTAAEPQEEVPDVGVRVSTPDVESFEAYLPSFEDEFFDSTD